MYEAFFGLTDRPFDLTPNPRFLVLTPSHREVLSTLEYAISSRKPITLLIGDAGLGKTTLIRAAIANQPAHVHCVHVSNPTLSRTEFVEMLAGQFGLSDRAAGSKTALLDELEAELTRRRAGNESTVIVFDEAQSLSTDLLEEIRLLANLETDAEKLLSVILAGQPELAERLNAAGLRQLKQRIALRCELQALKPQETAAYIAGRIRVAGGVGAQVFTREAVTAIHERASGIPRLVSVLADNSMLGGFAAGKRPVGSDIVREVSRDFDLSREADGAVAPPPAPVTQDLVKSGTPPKPRPAETSRLLVVEERPARQHPTESPDEASATGRPDADQAATDKRRRFFFFGTRGA